MNIPLRGKVYELTEEIEYDDDVFPIGSRFKIQSIRVTTKITILSLYSMLELIKILH